MNLDYNIDSINFYNDTRLLYYKAKDYIWFHLAFIIIILVTIVGNMMVVLAVVKNRVLQNTTNYFLTSLAIADLLVAIIVMPINVIAEIIGYFPFGSIVCNIWVSSDILLCTSSIWHMCLMSMDRFFTIRFPLKYGRNKTRRFMIWKIIIVWVISFLICSPMLMLGFIEPTNVYTASSKLCSLNHANFKLYGSIFAFYIPFLIITVTYTFTIKALKKLMKTKELTKSDNKTHKKFTLLTDIFYKKDFTDSNSEILKSETSRSSKTYDYKKRFSTTLNKMPKIESVNNFNEASESKMDKLEKLNNELQSSKRLNDSISLNQFSKNYEFLKSNEEETTLFSYDIGNINSLCGNKLILSTNLLGDNYTNKQINDELEDSLSNINNPINFIRWSKSENNLNEFMIHNKSSNSNSTKHYSLIDLNFPISNYLSNIHFDKSQYSNSSSKKFQIKEINNSNSCNYNRENSRSCLSKIYLEPSSFKKSKIRLKKLRRIEKVLFGIEYEMYNILNQNEKPVILSNSLSLTSMLTNDLTPRKSSNPKNCMESTHELKQENINYNNNNNVSYIKNKNKISKFYPKISKSNSKTNILPNHTITSNYINYDSINTFDLKYKLRNFLMKPSKSKQKFSTEIKQDIEKSKESIILETNKQRFANRSKSIGTNSSDYILRSNSLVSEPKFSRFSTKVRICSRSNNERKALKVLIIIFSIFVLFWTPFFLVNLVSAFCASCTFISPNLIVTITWLGYGSSTINPIIYTMFNKSFRRAFLDLLKCRTIKNNDLKKKFLVYKDIRFDRTSKFV